MKPNRTLLLLLLYLRGKLHLATNTENRNLTIHFGIWNQLVKVCIIEKYKNLV